ncbi:hypothetical protein M0R45_036284 [Rubus argutus]|uniref:CCHC-type domain-containing protein n=1 Tax=Rubus argutus TaxID=59490 RepID=A0AAW1VVN4_RUBAR
MGEEDIQDPQASLERARLESSLAYGISLGENLGYHSSKVVHSSTLELHLWQNTTRTGGATTSTTGPPHDEEVAKLFQAFMKIASFELEGTAGVNRRLKFLKVFISLYPPKVGFAAYTLTGAAGYWWDLVKRTRDVESMTWDDFEQLFLNRYFPKAIRDAKVQEFVKLTQGEMTVFQYDSKFIELSWHAPNHLSSDEDMAERESKSHLREIVVEGGERQRKPYSCYNCGEPGHIQPHCPYILPPSYL